MGHDESGIPPILYLPCLESDLLGPAGSLVRVAVAGIIITGILSRKDHSLRGHELHDVVSGREVGEEVPAVCIGLCCGYLVEVCIPENDSDTFDPRFTGVLDAVCVGVVPDEVPDGCWCDGGRRGPGFCCRFRARRADLWWFWRFLGWFRHSLRFYSEFHNPGVGLHRPVLGSRVERPGEEILGAGYLDGRCCPVSGVGSAKRSAPLNPPGTVEFHDPGVAPGRVFPALPDKEVAAVGCGDDRCCRLVCLRIPVGPVPDNPAVRSHPDHQGIVLGPVGCIPAHVTPGKDEASIWCRHERPGSIVLRTAKRPVPDLVPRGIEFRDPDVGGERPKRLCASRDGNVAVGGLND